MINVKEVEPKTSAKKKVITIKDVHIDENGNFVDENGSVGQQILPEIPDGCGVFTFKITFALSEDDEAIEEEPEDSALPF